MPQDAEYGAPLTEATGVLADELLDALDHGALVRPLSERQGNFSLSAAYALAQELAFRRHDRGERGIGRKLGFTNRALWELLGVAAPFWGTVYDSTVRFLDEPLGQINLTHLSQPRLEPELVLHFGSTPPTNASEAELLAHIDWVAFGFELVQCHFAGWEFETADAVADFGVHGALVVGPTYPVANIPDALDALQYFTVTLKRDGQVQATGGGVNVLGSPVRAVVEVAAAARAMPGWVPLTANEVVTTGTLTGLHQVHPGETWSIEASGLGPDALSLTIGQ